MRRIITSRDDWSTILVEDIEIEQPVGPGIDQQPSDNKDKQEDSSTESQDVIPDEETADAGAPEGQGINLETDAQELMNPLTRDECGDNPDVIAQALVNPETIEMPEAGEGKPTL